MGLCFTKEDDERLARGWPYLVVPVDGEKADKVAAAQKAWRVSDPIYFTEWPRGTLYRFMNAGIENVFRSYPPERGGAAYKKLEDPTPPSAKTCLDALGRLFREGYATYSFEERDFVYGVETVAGTDATLGVLAAEIEAFEVPRENPGLNHLTRAHLAEMVAFLLLRATPAAAKDARERIERALSPPVKDKITPKPGYDLEALNYYFDALDYALHGAAGVRRHTGKWVYLEVPALSFGATLDYAGDDPDYVRDMVPKADKKAGMSVRIPAIAGASVLAGLEARKWPAAQLPSIVRDFGMIRDPAIVTLMLSLIGKSSVKDGPMKWFQAHADYARPILQKTKSDVAKSVLRQLG